MNLQGNTIVIFQIFSLYCCNKYDMLTLNSLQYWPLRMFVFFKKRGFRFYMGWREGSEFQKLLLPLRGFLKLFETRRNRSQQKPLLDEKNIWKVLYYKQVSKDNFTILLNCFYSNENAVGFWKSGVISLGLIFDSQNK